MTAVETRGRRPVGARTPITKPRRPELFFGLVGAIGTDLVTVADILKEALAKYNYNCSNRLHLITDLRNLKLTANGKPLWTPHEHDAYYDKRAWAQMDLGNDYCSALQLTDAMAILGITSVRYARERVSHSVKKPADHQAYLISSLKRPAEVTKLRRVYGPAFFLLSVYSRRPKRVEALAAKIAKSRGSARPDRFMSHAERLVTRDEEDITRSNEFGQNVQDTFHRADVFLDTDDQQTLREQVDRFIALVFGDPHLTPYPDEYGMFLAQAAGFRSGDTSRQVGASVVSPTRDVLSLGTNDAPKAKGDLYWPDDPYDARDIVLRTDSSVEVKEAIVRELLEKLSSGHQLSKRASDLVRSNLEEAAKRALKSFRRTQLLDLTEFGRSVHAEMTALLGAARRGVSVQGATLYTTLFPCHNCAKHILAAGIERVVYIEPYPKSRALALHGDAIALEGHVPKGPHITFGPFVGVAPRRYADLFGFAAKERKELIAAMDRNRSEATPRFMKSGDYYQREYLRFESKEEAWLKECMDECHVKAHLTKKRTPRAVYKNTAARRQQEEKS